MSKEPRLFTSESVSAGHPDKVCDHISDGVLDACLAQDPDSRVACETLCTTGLVVIAGEITTKAKVNFEDVARQVIMEIGYTDPTIGFSYESCGVICTVHSQSPDIAMGVDSGKEKEQGAGDQGLMFGFACRETPTYMPYPVYYSHRILEKLTELRMSGKMAFLRPDAKSQLTVEYDEKHNPVRIRTVVVSHQHTDAISNDKLHAAIREAATSVLPKEHLDKDTKWYINPTGRFVIGGPKGDSGLTGRKIIVDSYGGMGRHGGGAFSGKDPSKVDRSAAYAARHVAKNLVAAGLGDRCEVQVAYAIGVADPLSIRVDTFGTGKLPEQDIVALVRKHWDLKPAGIIKHFQLKRPIYRKTAAFGHFGRELPEFTWEKLDKVDVLKAALKQAAKA